ncbi:MAG: LacI family DNA-binding transcriptional regulator [Pyramidobacter sp.]|jgi:LacI family transcriptional regulator
MARVIMSDVAELAGVNKGTVSRALRGDPRISPETRQRVWDAAKKLGYELNAVASGLSSHKTNLVGVAVERINAPWLGDFLGALSGVLNRFKMELLLFDVGTSAVSIENALRRINSRKADGVIWAGGRKLNHDLLDVPVVRVGLDAYEGEYLVGLERQATLDCVKNLAGERPVIYRGGSFAFAPFLSDLQLSGGKGSPFIVWDGLDDLPQGEKPSLVCGGEQTARLLSAACLRFPARQLGALSARVLNNILRGTGVRPKTTLVKVPLVSPTGEFVLP